MGYAATSGDLGALCGRVNSAFRKIYSGFATYSATATHIVSPAAPESRLSQFGSTWYSPSSHTILFIKDLREIQKFSLHSFITGLFHSHQSVLPTRITKSPRGPWWHQRWLPSHAYTQKEEKLEKSCNNGTQRKKFHCNLAKELQKIRQIHPYRLLYVAIV